MPVYSTACPRNCYSSCSFKVHVEDNKVVNIDPHPGNLATPEGICLKGLAYVERANSPDRILTPLIKNKSTGKFDEADWETIFKLLAEKINHFKTNFGNHSFGTVFHDTMVEMKKCKALFSMFPENECPVKDSYDEKIKKFVIPLCFCVLVA
jgi:anaerobic selenocysteine-containing dehydrogenase